MKTTTNKWQRVFLLLNFLLAGIYSQIQAQAPAGCTQTPVIFAGWIDLYPGNSLSIVKSLDPFSCRVTGLVASSQGGLPRYCPLVANGCGNGYISFGTSNLSTDFAHWLNVQTYYDCMPPFDCNSDTFDPYSSANLYIVYKIPKGQTGCLTSLALNPIGYYGIPFAKQGMAVFKNDGLIYQSTVPMPPASATPFKNTLDFPFSGSEFCSDGSQDVTFKIVFAPVKKISNNTGNFGYSTMILYGVCGNVIASAMATATTCGQGGLPNSNGKITLSNFTSSQHYDYVEGSTYTGTKTYNTASVIPTNGVIVSNLPDPGVTKKYTIRVFDASGCYNDITVTLLPTSCPSCNSPTNINVSLTPATCTGNTPNNNASIAISGITGGDKIGISTGTTYTGPNYSSANTLTNGGYTFANLTNPISSQSYTIRVYGSSNECYRDTTVSLVENTCGPCSSGYAQILTSNSSDPNSMPGNGVATEDDFTTFQSCTNPQNIDLKLTKSVTPATGTTCPIGTVFTWTLTLTNEGTQAATNIQVADLMPLDSLSLLSATASVGTFSSMAAGWLVNSLGAGQSATLNLVTKALKPGVIKNCAEVMTASPLNDPDSTPGNEVQSEDDYACASITVTGSSPPSLKKEFSPTNAAPNTPIRLILTLHNNQSTPITLSENLVDSLPMTPYQMVIAPQPNVSTTNGLVVMAAAGSKLFFIPKGQVLLPGETMLSLNVIAQGEGKYCNVIAAGALQTQEACGNVAAAQACVDVKVGNPIPPLVSKSFSTPRLEANQIGYLTITIENKNNSNMTLEKDLIDKFPHGLVLANGTNTGTCAGVKPFAAGDTTVTLTTGSIIPPGGCTIIVPVKSSTIGKYCNSIFINALIVSMNGALLANEECPMACIDIIGAPIFDLALTKKLASGQSGAVLLGDTVTHTIEVINQGTVAATNIQVTDYIPSSMSLVADVTWTLSGSNAVLATPIATLAPGASQIIPIKLKIVSGAVGDTLVNRAEISAASGGTDNDSSPDSNSGNDAGGRYNSPSDDSVNGNGTGQPNDRSGLTDEDDADPDYVVLTQCVNSNLAAGVILSPKAIRSQNDVVQITFGLTNPGAVPLKDITFVGLVKPFNRPNGTPVTLTLTKQGDTNSDGIMDPNEAWLYTGTFSSSYTPGTVFVVTGEATASCGSATIKAATADLLYTVGVNMDVVKGACVTPGGTLNVDLVTRLLVDEDMARNPGSITVGSINIPLPKRRFEARDLKITVQGVNNNQPFDPFNPPSGVSVVRLTDQGNVDGGRNTNNILDESDPVNTYRAPCTALGQDDVGCAFPDWVFRVQVPIPSNYSSSTFVVSASDDFKLYQSVEDPAGSGTFKPFEDIPPTGGSGGSDSETFTVCSSAGTTDLRLKSQVSQSQTTEGTEVEYMIKVWNESSTPATGVEVADSLVGGLRYVSSSATRGSYNPTTYRWVIGTVGANGDTVTLRIRVRVVSQGVFFNTVELVKYNEQDVDSTPGNGTEGEDDLDHQCVTVPISLCTGEEVEVSLPSNFSGVKWYKNGVEISSLTGRNVVLLSESGTYSYTATNNSCPVEGCCPIVIRGGSNCCPVDLCIPLTIKKKKKR